MDLNQKVQSLNDRVSYLESVVEKLIGQRECITCKYEEHPVAHPPCNKCDGEVHSLWEPQV